MSTSTPFLGLSQPVAGKNRKYDSWYRWNQTSRYGNMTRFDISENVNIHSGSDNLEDSELVTGLCNTKDNNALEVTVKGNDDEGSPSDEEEEENVSNIELVQVEKASRIKYQGTTLDIILLTAKTIS
ncbi:uncharacterized protein OCT59_025319 [Rhizophagus irregularis]|uniref:uncharacterized protein n=1 Tax=Rhizophagus irregularis TaxID=588596 RepID=UPI0033341971|nr:hypothetical protein OCT59_025319 [Rhizophagus irregularis]